MKNNRQLLLDEVFVISRIIKVEVRIIRVFVLGFSTLNSSTDTNSGVHQSTCHLRCLILLLSTLLYLTLSLPCPSAVTDLSNKSLIFHDFQGATIKFHDFPFLENEILYSMTFQVFHNLCEPWIILDHKNSICM